MAMRLLCNTYFFILNFYLNIHRIFLSHLVRPVKAITSFRRRSRLFWRFKLGPYYGYAVSSRSGRGQATVKHQSAHGYAKHSLAPHILYLGNKPTNAPEATET